MKVVTKPITPTWQNQHTTSNKFKYLKFITKFLNPHSPGYF